MERGQELAESLVELMHGLAVCAFPEIGIEFTDDMRATLHARVVWLIKFSEPVKVTSSEDLNPLLQALPALETLLSRWPASEFERAEVQAFAENLIAPLIDRDELARAMGR